MTTFPQLIGTYYLMVTVSAYIFKEKIFEKCQKFIPMSSILHQKSTPPWWTKTLSRAMLKKGYCILNTGQLNLQVISATMLLNGTWLKLLSVQPK